MKRFRYISPMKLVATYLRDYSFRSDGEPSSLYWFVLALCLPFSSGNFRRARLEALAISECSNSADQIARVLNKTTGATITFQSLADTYYMSYDGSDMQPDFPFTDLSDPVVPFKGVPNKVIATVTLNGASRAKVSAYLKLMIPFYIDITINYV